MGKEHCPCSTILRHNSIRRMIITNFPMPSVVLLSRMIKGSLHRPLSKIPWGGGPCPPSLARDSRGPPTLDLILLTDPPPCPTQPQAWVCTQKKPEKINKFDQNRGSWQWRCSCRCCAIKVRHKVEKANQPPAQKKFLLERLFHYSLLQNFRGVFKVCQDLALEVLAVSNTWAALSALPSGIAGVGQWGRTPASSEATHRSGKCNKAPQNI